MCRADHIGSPIQADSLNNAVCSECTLVDPIMKTDSILAESRIQTYSNNILYIRMLKKAIAAAKRKSDPSQKDAAPKKKPKNNEKNKNKVVKTGKVKKPGKGGKSKDSTAGKNPTSKRKSKKGNGTAK